MAGQIPRLKTCFIINPRSGCAAKARPTIEAFAAQHRSTVRLTERSRHASELAARAVDEGFELVVAVGGDGTMNEVASALLDCPATLGLVPCGSGDGLGRHLGIHGSPAHALHVLRHGQLRRIDSGSANGHPFFTAAGIGFEAEIAQRFNTLTRRGFARYLSTSARAFRRWRPEEYVVTHDGHEERFRAFTLTVANANQYGNEARIAPWAQLDDGQLDLCVVPPVGLRNALPLALRLFHGSLASPRDVQLRQSARFTVLRPAPGLLHTDGEVHAAGRELEFVVRPASLRVMCPAREGV